MHMHMCMCKCMHMHMCICMHIEYVPYKIQGQVLPTLSAAV